VSRTVAAVYAATNPGVRAIVRRNLSLLLGDGASDRDAARVFVNYGACIADYVAVGAMSRERALGLCAGHEGVSHVASLAATGAILVTAHLGFFEFGCVVMGAMGIPVTVATLPEPSTDLTAWRAKWRGRWGVETVPVGADPFSSIGLLRALESGRCVAMLADRPIIEHGIPVDLPHGRIPFSTSPALLAWMTGRPILPVAVVRESDGRYRVMAGEPLTVTKGAGLSRDDEIADCTRRLAAALLETVRRHPHQWFQFVPL